jgi:hypothetical protein
MPSMDLPKCDSCGKEIPLLPKSKGEDIVNIGGIIGVIDMGQLYMGQICESCHHIICTSCWVSEIAAPESFDKCSKCGGHLVCLSSKNIP